MPTKFTPIVTQRLKLRSLSSSDLVGVSRINSCPITTEHVSWAHESMAHSKKWLTNRIAFENQNLFGFWAVETSKGQLVGFCGFLSMSERALELGYVIHHSYQGNGYAKEATKACVKVANSNRRPVFATIRKTNLASRRVAETAGLKFIGAQSSLLLYGTELLDWPGSN